MHRMLNKNAAEGPRQVHNLILAAEITHHGKCGLRMENWSAQPLPPEQAPIMFGGQAGAADSGGNEELSGSSTRH